jgi:methyl-accepting chemotaxis protein
MTIPSRPPDPASSLETTRYKRSFRNYLIDSRFQLKYTSFILLAAIAVSAVLGTFLWRTSGEVVAESQKVVAESMKVSAVVKMTIKDDYADSPELAKAFEAKATQQDGMITQQQDALVRQQRTMLYALVGALALMVFVVGVLGIYFTHKVAGPVHKMKRLLNQVSEGKLRVTARLRKGDELQDFFDVFAAMVENLRARKEAEVEALDAALVVATTQGLAGDALAALTKVRDDMRHTLDV